MRIFTLSALLLLTLLLSGAFSACQRIDVDEHEYDTVKPYLPNITPDSSVVTQPVTENSPAANVAADGDADGSENETDDDKSAVNIPEDLRQKILESAGQMNLHIQQNYPHNAPAAPQK